MFRTPLIIIRPILLFLMLLPFIAFSAATSMARAASNPDLGSAAVFAVVGASTVTNTGPSILSGGLAVSPGTSCTGFAAPCTGGPGQVNGPIHTGDAVAAKAQANAHTAYANAASQACNTNLTGQDLGGKTLIAGVYCFNSSAHLTGQLTLDGQGNHASVFIIQIGSTLTTASHASVLLINGAQSSTVWWQVGSSATLGTSTSFAGSILAEVSITATTNVVTNCGLYALTGAVTLDTNRIGVCSSDRCPLSIVQWGCPNQRTFIEGAPSKENYSPNTMGCTLGTDRSCSVFIINSTNVTQAVESDGLVLFKIKLGSDRRVSYTYAGMYVYELSSNPNNPYATLIVTVQ